MSVMEKDRRPARAMLARLSAVVDRVERPATIILWVLVGLMVLALVRLVIEPVETPRTALERDLLDWRARVSDNRADAHARQRLGVVYLEMGRYEQAAAEFKQAIRLAPSNAKYRYGLALAYRDMGNDRELVKHLTEAIRLSPRWQPPYYELGDYYLSKGQLKQAVSWLTNSTQLFPDSADSHYRLGQAYEKQGNTAAAIKEYEQVLKYLPDHEASARRLARLKEGKVK